MKWPRNPPRVVLNYKGRLYYVKYKNKLIAVPADEAIIVVEKSHTPGSDEEHGEKPEKDDAKKLDPDEEEDSERKRSD